MRWPCPLQQSPARAAPQGCGTHPRSIPAGEREDPRGAAHPPCGTAGGAAGRGDPPARLGDPPALGSPPAGLPRGRAPGPRTRLVPPRGELPPVGWGGAARGSPSREGGAEEQSLKWRREMPGACRGRTAARGERRSGRDRAAQGAAAPGRGSLPFPGWPRGHSAGWTPPGVRWWHCLCPPIRRVWRSPQDCPPSLQRTCGGDPALSPCTGGAQDTLHRAPVPAR